MWTHPTRLPEDISSQAAEVVVSGLRQRIDIDPLRASRERELQRKREWRLKQKPMLPTLPWDFDISPPGVPFE